MEYKVILDYPNSNFYVGQILELTKDKFGDGYRYEWYEHEGKNWMYQSEFDDYPHIFSKIIEEK